LVRFPRVELVGAERLGGVHLEDGPRHRVVDLNESRVHLADAFLRLGWQWLLVPILAGLAGYALFVTFMTRASQDSRSLGAAIASARRQGLRRR